MEFDKGDTVFYYGTPGVIVRTSRSGQGSARATCSNVWADFAGTDWEDTEIMFSLRADGAWRAFPGPADAEGLVAFMPERVLVS